MLLAEVVATVDAVTATRSRLAKIEALAELLGRLEPDEVVPAVGMLIASPRQGRVGVGWRGIAALDTVHAADSSVTIADVDAALDALAAASGAGSTGTRSGALHALAARCTAAEWDLVVRVLLGEMRTGALEGVLLDAIARASGRAAADVRRAAMLSGDLGETAAIALTADAADLAAVGLRVGRPVLPMLASTAASVTEAIGVAGEASVEFKLDGARIQVHRDGENVQVFTRNLADITSRVPEIVEAVRGLDVRSVILDGETLSLHEDGGPRAFQDTMARFGAELSREIALRPWFFDVLHVDGRDLIDEPLSVRRGELARIAGAWGVPGVVTADAAEADELSRRSLAAGHEGVVVKAIDGAYAAGRRGRNWIKVKPVLTYDLVVLGVEWGSGRRSGWLSNLHLGALDPDGDFGEPGGFVMVGKTFKGLTDELLRWQTEWFPQIEVRRTAQTLYVSPVTVVEIAIDGVQRSPRYPGEVALRFARVKAYRPDKRPDEADTIGTLRALQRRAAGAEGEGST